MSDFPSVTLPEGTTVEQTDPQPIVWPVCIAPTKWHRSDTETHPCETPFVRRLFFSLTGPRRWAWAPDCKHKITGEHVRMEIADPTPDPAVAS